MVIMEDSKWAMEPYQVTNCLRWKNLVVFVDQLVTTSETVIMPLCNKVWPHKTTMQLWIFSSELQFISITTKLFCLITISATVAKCLFRPCGMLVHCRYFSLAVVTAHPTHSPPIHTGQELQRNYHLNNQISHSKWYTRFDILARLFNTLRWEWTTVWLVILWGSIFVDFWGLLIHTNLLDYNCTTNWLE